MGNNSAPERKDSAVAYFCNRCGYKWNSMEYSSGYATYCPNCYKKDIERFTKFREMKKNIQKKSKKTKKELNGLISQINEKTSFFWLDNQQLFTTLLFIGGLVIILFLSAKYFLL